jgi:eukaryotic-like serine/threonine-protein kinase
VTGHARGLSDAAVTRLRTLGRWPEFESGRYSVTEEIGRGGMGTVFLAIDEELGREVAIKIPNALGSDDLERRLRSEARVLAHLEHPGIVPIHDAGRLADGRLFYVMKRVKGQTLRDHVRTAPGLAERLRLFERVCEPVAFAHARGFIHRDLKPENVMVGAYGEVMVMDWGLVKAVGSLQSAVDSPQSSVDGPQSTVLSRQSSPVGRGAESPGESSPVTGAGTVIGTVGFMAPEQARGDAAAVDTRSDVYGLGAILFLLLTDAVPGAGLQEALRSARVPRPLAAICSRALENDPGNRYPSVDALAEDVRRFRDNRPVDAYRETWFERSARFGRTHRTAILLILAYVIMRAAVALLAGR